MRPIEKLWGNRFVKMKNHILLCVFMALILSGCGDQKAEIENKNIIEDYGSYAGTWTENGIAHEDILENGGVELQVGIRNKSQVEASIFIQQGQTERFAQIEEMKCEIKDGVASYKFGDDGWNNKGTLFLQFSEDGIKVWVEDFVMASDNTSGFGISGSYELEKVDMSPSETADESIKDESQLEIADESQSEIADISPSETTDDGIADENTTEEEALWEQIDKRYYDRFTEEEMMDMITEKSSFLQASSYYSEITRYREDVQEIRDISNVIVPLFFTDMKYYEERDFDNCSLEVLKIAKNEIYAQHGWIFKDEDLKNYFLGQLWYDPTIEAEDFDDSVFNEYEVYNLELILTCIEKMEQ